MQRPFLWVSSIILLWFFPSLSLHANPIVSNGEGPFTGRTSETEREREETAFRPDRLSDRMEMQNSLKAFRAPSTTDEPNHSEDIIATIVLLLSPSQDSQDPTLS